MLFMQQIQERNIGDGKVMAEYETAPIDGGPLFFRIYTEWQQGESQLWKKGESRFSINLLYSDAISRYSVDAMTAWTAARRAMEAVFVSQTGKIVKVGNGWSYGSRSLKAFFLCAKEDTFRDDLERWLKALATSFDTFLATPQAALFAAPSLAARPS
jgi:hypothetical protein